MSIKDQPPPIPNESLAIWDLVIADMRERDHFGRQRYGTPLQANNGRDPLVDAYQEALDLAVYLRQVIEEREPVDWRARAWAAEARLERVRALASKLGDGPALDMAGLVANAREMMSTLDRIVLIVDEVES